MTTKSKTKKSKTAESSLALLELLNEAESKPAKAKKTTGKAKTPKQDSTAPKPLALPSSDIVTLNWRIKNYQGDFKGEPSQILVHKDQVDAMLSKLSKSYFAWNLVIETSI
jgi:hypothetical protein